MYKAVRDFRDLQDSGHLYYAGDSFPRMGLEVSKKRIEELSTANNRSKSILIKLVEETHVPEALEEKKEKGKRKNARTNIESDKKLLHS